MPEENQNVVSFSVNTLTVKRESKDGQTIPLLYQKLIKSAKSLIDIPGGLYAAAETLPLDTPNVNFIEVRTSLFTKRELNNFVKTFIDPIPIPIIYNHKDGSGWFDGEPSSVVGRVAAAVVDKTPIDQKKRSIFTGQVITKQETIDKIMNLEDFSQSITFSVMSYSCSHCNGDMLQGACDHRPGYRIRDEEGKTTGERVTHFAIPKRATEESFVLIPAFKTAMLKALEQNNSTKMAHPHLTFLEYMPKIMSNGVSLPNNNIVDNIDQEESSIVVAGNIPEDLKNIQQHGKIDGEQIIGLKSQDQNGGIENVNAEELSKMLNGLKDSVETLKNSVAKAIKPDTQEGKASPEKDPTVTISSDINAEVIEKLTNTFSEAMVNIVDQVVSLTSETANLIASSAELIGKVVPVKSSENVDDNKEPGNSGDETEEAVKEKKKNKTSFAGSVR